MLFDLFITFAKIGVMTFGGGYAMLPILQRELVENKGWTTEEDIADYFAIGQCTPGIIAINTATFVGTKQKGIIGGIVASLGMVFPSLVIITLIATVLTTFSELEVVKHAFAGIRVAVCVLIFNSVLKLMKSAIKDYYALFIFIGIFLVSLFSSISTVYLIVASAVLGIVINTVIKKKGGKTE